MMVNLECAAIQFHDQHKYTCACHSKLMEFAAEIAALRADLEKAQAKVCEVSGAFGEMTIQQDRRDFETIFIVKPDAYDKLRGAIEGLIPCPHAARLEAAERTVQRWQEHRHSFDCNCYQCQWFKELQQALAGKE